MKKSILLFIVFIALFYTNAISQRINDLAIFDSKLLVATDKGLFNVSDKGNVWTKIDLGPDVKSVGQVITNGSSILVYCHGDLLISKNKGANWTKVNNCVECEGIIDILLVGTTIFTETYKGVYKTYDNGNQWIKLKSVQKYSQIFSPEGTERIFCTFKGKTRFSDDKGETWVECGLSLTKDGKVYSMVSNGNDYYAATSVGVEVSKDKGVTWSSYNREYFSLNNIAIIGKDIFASGFYRAEMYRSSDSGLKWEKVRELDLNAHRVYAMQNLEKDLYVIWDGELHLSTDMGTTWSQTFDIAAAEKKSAYEKKEKEMASIISQTVSSYFQGIANIFYKNYYDAIAKFSTAIKNMPDLAEAYYFRSYTYNKLGKFDEARSDYSKGSKLVCDSALFSIARSFNLIQETDSMIKYLTLYLKASDNPETFSNRYNHIQLFANSDDKKNLEKWAELKSMVWNGNSAKIAVLKKFSDEPYRRMYKEEVEYYYKFAIKESTYFLYFWDDVESRHAYAYKLFKEGKTEFDNQNYRRAISLFSDAITYNNTVAEYYLMRGSGHDRLNHEAEAEKDFASALKLKPNANVAAYKISLEEKEQKKWISSTDPCPRCDGSGSLYVGEKIHTKTESVLDINNRATGVIRETTYKTTSYVETCDKCGGKGRIPKVEKK